MTETNSNENIGSINNTDEEEITSSSASITPTPTPTPTNSKDPHRRQQQEQNKKQQDEKIRKDQKRKRLCIGTSILFIIIALSIIVVIGIKFKEKLQDESLGSNQQNNNINNMTDYYEWCEQKYHNMHNQEVFSMNENQNCRITVSLKQKQIVYDVLFSSEFDDEDSFFSNGKNICPCEGLDKCCTNEEKAYEWFVRLSNSDHYRKSHSHDRDDDRYLKELFVILLLYINIHPRQFYYTEKHYKYNLIQIKNTTHHCDWDFVYCSRSPHHNNESYSMMDDIGILNDYENNMVVTGIDLIADKNNDKDKKTNSLLLDIKIPSQIGYLTYLESITFQWFYKVPTHQTIPLQILKNVTLLPNLESISFLDNVFLPDNNKERKENESIPIILGQFQRLRHLHIYDSFSSGELPKELFMTMVSNKDDNNDNRNESLPSPLSKTLETFIIESNSIQGEIPTEIGLLNSSSIKTITIYDNPMLTGEIPLELMIGGGNTTTASSSLIKLDLSHNALSGKIPSRMNQLQRLEALYLNGNQLTSSIPKELGDLQYLSVLHLEGNEFTNQIPHELCYQHNIHVNTTSDINNNDTLYSSGNSSTTNFMSVDNIFISREIIADCDVCPGGFNGDCCTWCS